MRAESLFFQHDVPLTGTLYLPVGPGPHPVVVILHAASGGDRAYPFYHHLIEHLPPAGIGVCLYDRRGSGQSGGGFTTADFELLAADGAAAVDILATHPAVDAARIGVYGISQGSWLAPIVAARRPAVACVVAVSGSGVTPARQMDYAAARNVRAMGFDEESVARVLYLRARVNDTYRGRLSPADVQPELDAARAELWYAHAFLKNKLPENVRDDKWFHEFDYDPLPIWKEVTQPTLFLFPGDDRWVPVEESIAAYRTATAGHDRVVFAIIPNADHLMGLEHETAPRISAAYLSLLRGWLVEQLLRS